MNLTDCSWISTLLCVKFNRDRMRRTFIDVMRRQAERLK